MKHLTAIDLFSGCGGLTLGLKRAGFGVVAAIESDQLAATTYKSNHPHVRVFESDIRKVRPRGLMKELGLKPGQLDLLAGCPPCQGFSVLRTRNGATRPRDKRNGLISEMLRFARALRPKSIMVENVPGLSEHQSFRDFCRDLRRLGYIVEWDIKDASHYGVPQRRKRLILVAGQGFDIPFANKSTTTKTVRSAIGHLAPTHKSRDRLHSRPQNRSDKVVKLIRAKQVFHNDLHAGNIIIEKLRKESYRADAIDSSIRAVAIDLGSAAIQTKSDPKKQREGDISRIAEHIARLSAGLLTDPDGVSDHDFRLASTLQDIFQVLAAPAENTRFPSTHDLVVQVKLAYEVIPRHSWRSWRQPLALTSFGAAYNALTLEPWHVPALLIDPEGSWLNQISTPGPQIITGMRGCGKTMLLRALQFHARASQARGESTEAVINRIGDDGYMGLFVSAQRLIDRPGPDHAGADPFTRLILAYAVEAVRSIMHMQDISPESADNRAHRFIGKALANIFHGAEPLSDSLDLDDLDARLSRALVQHSRPGGTLRLQVNPDDAFIHLAEAVRTCSPYWMNCRILFLLDDVSTRYLKGGPIRQLLSALLFQHPACAFKITSEVQTMELELRTPGENFLAREGRDYSVFDLGSEVYDKIKGAEGKDFVEKILSQRAAHFSAHPRTTPSQILGDENMETIAREIAETTSTSSKRKEVYSNRVEPGNDSGCAGSRYSRRPFHPRSISGQETSETIRPTRSSSWFGL